ncbi:UDP-N-acetylglucosamine 2-epimerase [Gallibacter sp. Marseille-QA0791]|uniref:UDP-N-acetylglucosamine 2-epimerase n=1 Tax=Gallibacter sp. Marseille-QA0791 TaxID=3378781 RepID=UPI003D136CCD
MRILSITGNRADYDLMSYLYKYFNNDPDIDFGLIVTGAHLTTGYEASIEAIKKDGNKIVAKIADIFNSDTRSSRAKSTGVLISGLTDFVDQFNPDIVIAPGDREEVIAMGIVASYMQIPFVHFFGGDFAESGHVDNMIRHASSKMASVHMVSLEEHKRRLISLGEDEKSIFNIGSVALDKFKEEPYVCRDDLLKRLGIEEFSQYALLIYHPPAEIQAENEEISKIMEVLSRKKIKTVVSYPNTDFNNSSIIKVYEEYKGNDNFFFYKNLDRNTFVNLYRNAAFQIGNSSSGVCEAASIPIPVINIGTRQKDRGNTENVMYLEDVSYGLEEAIECVMSDEYRQSIKGIKNIFGDGDSSQRAYELIKKIDFSRWLLKVYDPLKEEAQ